MYFFQKILIEGNLYNMELTGHILKFFFFLNPELLFFELFLNIWIQAIMAEGKQQALCVGVMKMSAESM